MIPHRLALAGRMGTGKTSVADILMRRHGYVRLAFGDELRAMLEVAYGRVDKAAIYQTASGILTGRELMQQAGGALRSVDERIFVRAMARRISELGPLMRIVIDDVRLPLEAEFVRDLGFTLVRLECDEGTRRRRVGAAWSGLGDVTEAVNVPGVVVDTSRLDPQGVVSFLDAVGKQREEFPVWQE